MKTVHVSTSCPYDIVIGEGLIARCGKLMREAGISAATAAIVTDTTVNALYGDAVETSLREAGYSTLRYAFPAGEQHKRWDTLGEILEYLAENHLTRTDVIVALGGGVPGDVAGFAAAVYARGIRFVQIPTTLLAAVDSSVGGKTAVDLQAGKNLAGSFHQPSLVITDTDVIGVLPDALLSDGAAEVIKYGVLTDPALFDTMCMPDWRGKLADIIATCVSIKRDVVSEDEFDTGRRAFLNLGHTFGHAIEKCSGFTVSHGQGVAMGMVIAAGAAGKRDVCERIIAAARCCGLPVLPKEDPSVLAAASLNDKKRAGGTISLVLPEAIGSCYLKKTAVADMEQAFAGGIAMAEELV